jgi:TolB-like protein
MPSSLWSELKRRQVPKAAAGYAVSAWLLLQVADVTFGPLGVPLWVNRWLVVAAILGLPLVVALAWFFDLTRQGVNREVEPGAGGRAVAHGRSRRALLVIASSAGLAAVGVTAYLVAPRFSGLGDGAVKTVAVFSFDNLSGDASLDDLAIGVSDELRRRLGPIPGLRVIARESIRSPLLAGLGNADVAQRLGATHAVRGSLRRVGTDFSVHLSLERMGTGEELWSAQFERPASQLIELQARVTESVSEALVEHLSDEQRAQLRRQPTDSEQAWALYQRAVRWTDEWTQEAAEQAIVQLQEATRLDPEFALAYAALTDAYWGPLQMAQLPVDESLPALRSAVDRALAIDPNLSEAWAAAGGLASQFDWNAAKAHSLGRRAVELDPNSVLAWNYLAQYYMVFDPGNPEAKKANDTLVKLNPVAPWTVGFRASLAVNAYQTLREPALLDEAQALLVPAKQLGPDLWVIFMWECRIFRWKGQFAEAIAACQRAVEFSGGSLENHPALAVTYAVAGRRELAMEVLRQLEREAQRRYLPPFWFAHIHAALGNREECLSALERALRARDWYMVWDLDDPAFDFVRGEPRFQAVYRELGIPAPAVGVAARKGV